MTDKKTKDIEVELVFKGYKCRHCGHVWVPRQDERPKLCPKCHSATWDREPRKKAKA